MVLGGLECGGTKMVCAIGDENGRIIEKQTIPTESPEVTLPLIINYFKAFPIVAMGVASFGPIDLKRNSPTYGHITSSTKVQWRNYDLLGTLKKEFSMPFGFDTDVNGAVLGEVTYGSMKGISNGLYMTVGTGIGVGIYANGALIHGMMHPEAGHVTVKRHPEDTFYGNCVYHGDCLEGMASGSALDERFGISASKVGMDNPAWKYESYYLAQAIADYILTLSPEKIVLGGGVMNRKELFPMIRGDVEALLGGYLHTYQMDHIEDYIIPSSLGGDQGAMGCMKLAFDAAVSS